VPFIPPNAALVSLASVLRIFSIRSSCPSLAGPGCCFAKLILISSVLVLRIAAATCPATLSVAMVSSSFARSSCKVLSIFFIA
jgi:hypothetical protein